MAWTVRDAARPTYRVHPCRTHATVAPRFSGVKVPLKQQKQECKVPRVVCFGGQIVTLATTEKSTCGVLFLSPGKLAYTFS